MSTSPPFPPSGGYIEAVYASCRSARTAASISISSSGVTSLLDSLDEAQFGTLSSSHGLSFPLRFPSVPHEANFLCVLALLNAFSGYRVPLHKATASGAYQSVLKLLFGLYITGPEDALNAAALQGLTAARVAELMGVSLHEEKPHETISGLVVGTQGGDMHELVHLLVDACNDSGRRLSQAGFPSLGVFALTILKEAEKLEPTKAADYFVEKVVNLLPAFADQGHVKGQPVCVYKKAFFLLQALHQRLGETVKVPKPNALPMFVDNVVPTMLVRFGVLDLSNASDALRRLGAEIAKEHDEEDREEGVRLSKEDAYALRAATLDAGAHIVAQARQRTDWRRSMTEAQLDGYLWSVAKTPLLRCVPRMVERDTIMY